jgi:tetratricopeptide (TPR) repeat protein
MANEGRQLFKAGRFAEAVNAYQKQLADGSGDRIANVGGLAEALMAMGRYADAVPLLSEAGEYEKKIGLPGSSGRDTEISVCEWLSDNREHGLALMRAVVLGLRDGSIRYANDQIGGLKQGLLFNYMAVAANVPADRQLGTDFIRKMSQSKIAKNWPGPVGQYLLGVTSLEEALEAGTGARDFEQASQLAATDLLKRRRLTNVLFNAAVASRISGDVPRCSRFMHACATLENPLIELDWHLAKAEVTRGAVE